MEVFENTVVSEAGSVVDTNLAVAFSGEGLGSSERHAHHLNFGPILHQSVDARLMSRRQWSGDTDPNTEAPAEPDSSILCLSSSLLMATAIVKAEIAIRGAEAALWCRRDAKGPLVSTVREMESLEQAAARFEGLNEDEEKLLLRKYEELEAKLELLETVVRRRQLPELPREAVRVAASALEEFTAVAAVLNDLKVGIDTLHHLSTASECFLHEVDREREGGLSSVSSSYAEALAISDEINAVDVAMSDMEAKLARFEASIVSSVSSLPFVE